MKFQISMKTPDAVEQAIRDVVGREFPDDYHGEDMVEPFEQRKDELKVLCDKWFKYGETVVIEIDTETQTATVLPTRK